MAAFEHIIESCVRGFHVYKNIRTPTVNKQLKTRQEQEKPKDRFAVAVYKDDPNPVETVGHVPKECLGYSTCFTACWGDSTGPKKYPALVQSGLKIPCKYKFLGKKKYIRSSSDCC